MRQELNSLSGKRHGFTLVAVVVGLMVLVIVAAVAAPYVNERNDQQDAQRTSQMLRALSQALVNQTAANGVTGFCKQVKQCPARLHYLTTQITSTDTACISTTTPFAAANIGNWIGGAPYSGLPIVAGYGVPTPLGVIHDTVIRISTTLLELHIDSVTANQAGYLDVAVDGTANSASGVLQYGPTAVNTTNQQLYLVKYQFAPPSGTC